MFSVWLLWLTVLVLNLYSLSDFDNTLMYFNQSRPLDMKKGQSRNSLKTFSSSGHSGVRLNNEDLVNDKLLIDCGEDQDCVLGKFYMDNLLILYRTTYYTVQVTKCYFDLRTQLISCTSRRWLLAYCRSNCFACNCPFIIKGRTQCRELLLCAGSGEGC